MIARQTLSLLLVVCLCQSAIAKDKNDNPFKKPAFDKSRRAGSHCLRLLEKFGLTQGEFLFFVIAGATVTTLGVGFVLMSDPFDSSDKQRRLIRQLRDGKVNWSNVSVETIANVIEHHPPNEQELLIDALREQPFQNNDQKGQQLLVTIISRLPDSSGSNTTALLSAIQALSNHRHITAFEDMLRHFHNKGNSPPSKGAQHIDYLNATASVSQFPLDAEAVGKETQRLLLKDFDLSSLLSQESHPFSEPKMKHSFFKGLYAGRFSLRAYKKSPDLYQSLYNDLSDKTDLPTPHETGRTR